jgi:lipoprotein-anchoring transpeptidase ErfK/SrfK
MRDGATVLTTKVSSGRKEKPTPRGKYVVTQKYTEWRSTLYHNASMPFFMRLSCSPVGLHAGVIPDYPASHGCVRLPPNIAKQLYAMVPRGTVVEIR